MVSPALEKLIGTALTDTEFCAMLLGDTRRQVLQSFPLTEQEIEIVMSIRAGSLEQFARELEALLGGSDAPDALPPRE